jgi:hypothetical protein
VASFNPTQSYNVVLDLDGNIYALQGGIFYDRYGDSFTTLPPSKNGAVSPAQPSGSGNALTSNPLSQFAATTSAQLGGVISDKTGTGALVFANSPTLVAATLGTPASGNLQNCTGYPSDATKAAKSQPLFTKSFFISAPADGLAVYLPVEEGMVITKITAKTASGTTTLTGAINGTNITGTAVSASSTKSSQTYSAGNTANAGDDFTITASSSASPLNLGVTVVYTKTLS